MNQNINLLDDIEPELIRLVNEGNSQQSTSHRVESSSSLVTEESLDRMSPELWPELGAVYFTFEFFCHYLELNDIPLCNFYLFLFDLYHYVYFDMR